MKILTNLNKSSQSIRQDLPNVERVFWL